MYTRFQLSVKYLHYFLTAANGKGHGVHSPFVFDFIKNVLTPGEKYDYYAGIEDQRKKLRSNKDLIDVQDFGAGSVVIKTSRRRVKDIAGSSLKPPKYAQLLSRMVRYYNPGTIVELGTSFGITSSYLAMGNKNAKLYTCEGAGSIAGIAEQTFGSMQIRNIEMIKGDFGLTLPLLLSKIKKVDFAFVDGNHRKEPTLEYYQQLLAYATGLTIFVFDDIHWSAEMEAAWLIIQEHPAVTLTIDIFFIGIVFLNPDFKVKQHFTIRF